MILSHKRKFIFVHIPRTGGTIVSKNICKEMGISDWESFIGEPKSISPNSHPLEPKRFERGWKNGYKHVTAQTIKEKVGKKIWDSYFKFTFVRNPWDRTVSMYFKKRKESPNFLKCVWPKNEMAFNALLITKYKILAKKPHLQVESLESRDGEIDIDFVGKYENLREDYDKVSDIIGLKSGLSGTHDTTERKQHRDYYNYITKRIIRDRKKRDLETFDYSF